MVGCKETGKTIYADESFSISKSFYFIQKTYKLKDGSLYNISLIITLQFGCVIVAIILSTARHWTKTNLSKTFYSTISFYN